MRDDFTSPASQQIENYSVELVPEIGRNYGLSWAGQNVSHRSSLAHEFPPQLHQWQIVN